MEKIVVKKAKLLEILKKNKEEHREIFVEALEGYKKKVIDLLESRLAAIKSGLKVNLYFQVTEPVDQTKDYERAIGMLEMSLEDEVELNEQDYKCYVMDDWTWKHQFLTSNPFYSGKAASTLASYSSPYE